uniref:Ig-like domain-containing protein n=1 Tax=Oryzias melastigma TaxID=30732 RepID=A0A3B3CND0_ORYME
MKHLEMFELIYFEMIKDLLKPLKDEVMDLEGETVTLSCKYSGSVYNVQWYQQKSSSSPQFIIADFSAKTEKYSVKHDKQNQEFHLQISSAAVSDSAVYYCALRPTDQLTGTEGKSLTMRCNYQTDYSTPWLYWFRHDSDLQAPQFILWKGAKSSTDELIPDKRYESTTTDTSTELIIAKLTLADTALYYCAVDTQ